MGNAAIGKIQYWDGLPGLMTGATLGKAPQNYVSSQNIYVGARNNEGNAAYYFPGRIAEFAVWNTLLRPEAMWSIYNNGVPSDVTVDGGNYVGYTDNLILYWQMEEGTSTTLTDKVGNYNGTLVNSPTWASSDI
tara:strand:+ start:214 stop:615 length:402 start_codon:yes stop_codon:yes gene_type:complete